MEDLEKQLNKYLADIAEKITNDLADTILDRLQYFINIAAYQDEPNKYYMPDNGSKPTYEFYHSFKTSPGYKGLKEYCRDVIYDVSGMRLRAVPYTDENGNTQMAYSHTDEKGSDLREWLFDYLNARNPNGIGGFWDLFVWEFDYEFKNWVKDSFNKYGLDVKII